MTKKNVEKYVVAGNYSQFTNYVNKNLKDGVFYIYVYGPDQLRGLSEISGVFIGTFEERKDIEEIRLQIKLIKGRHTFSSLKPSYWSETNTSGNQSGIVATPITQLDSRIAQYYQD